MRKALILSLSFFFLVACGNQQAAVPQDASEGEIRMAEKMGITVQELRDMSHEEHMEAMRKLHQQ